ncbi:hypothetical protein BB561_005758 [Smittium simulii]|uniref:TNase-like domain-containing protein n=1 Tax=Smittium simulii TaxID=133385 RepID=A0A2T9Y8G4_9FUNG|nr:hypothetical protein BB561_005758 [Smittium simulii]
MAEKEHQKLLLLGLSFSSALIAASVYLYKFHYFQINTALDIPKSYFKTRTLKGIALKIPDGDNLRLYHCPTLKSSWRIKNELKNIKTHPYNSSEKNIKPTQKLSEKTINVRLYGIDAPEIGHFGNKSQKFAVEAREFLQSLVLGKKLFILPLKIDIYNRVVAVVYIKNFWFFNRDISSEMIKAGMATIYEGRDIAYHSGLNSLVLEEMKAKSNKIGIWSQSKKNLESPRDYKTRIRKIKQNKI